MYIHILCIINEKLRIYQWIRASTYSCGPNKSTDPYKRTGYYIRYFEYFIKYYIKFPQKISPHMLLLVTRPRVSLKMNERLFLIASSLETVGRIWYAFKFEYITVKKFWNKEFFQKIGLARFEKKIILPH